MNPKHQKLLADLADKTRRNVVDWESTEAENQFLLNLKSGAILFEKNVTFDIRKMANMVSFTVRILRKAEEIDSFTLYPEDELYDLADDLFETIRRKVFKVDEQLADIIAEIDMLGTN
jgi:hypothetical protein